MRAATPCRGPRHVWESLQHPPRAGGSSCGMAWLSLASRRRSPKATALGGVYACVAASTHRERHSHDLAPQGHRQPREASAGKGAARSHERDLLFAVLTGHVSSLPRTKWTRPPWTRPPRSFLQLCEPPWGLIAPAWRNAAWRPCAPRIDPPVRLRSGRGRQGRDRSHDRVRRGRIAPLGTTNWAEYCGGYCCGCCGCCGCSCVCKNCICCGCSCTT